MVIRQRGIGCQKLLLLSRQPFDALIEQADTFELLFHRDVTSLFVVKKGVVLENTNIIKRFSHLLQCFLLSCRKSFGYRPSAIYSAMFLYRKMCGQLCGYLEGEVLVLILFLKRWSEEEEV